MNVKKQAIENIRIHLTKEQSNIRVELKRNLYNLKKLVNEQTILKRQLAYYGELLKFID